jgi:hypothetical protein
MMETKITENTYKIADGLDLFEDDGSAAQSEATALPEYIALEMKGKTGPKRDRQKTGKGK